MFRTLIVCGALAALSTPALAADVVVRVAGKSETQVNAEIREAARSVCRDAMRGSIAGVYGQQICMRSVEDDAKAKLSSR